MAAGASPRWEEIWSGGLQPGSSFDTGAPSKCLMDVITDLPTGSTLVPGAGRAYDAYALASSGRQVVALDLAKTACERARDWLEAKAKESKGSAKTASNVVVQEGDFFTDSELRPGSFDLVWDCTFLCALDPSVRQAWAKRHAALIKPGGELVTLIFPIAPDKVGGPPYHLDVAMVGELVREAGFEEVKIYEMPAGTHISRVPFGNAVVRWRRKNS